MNKKEAMERRKIYEISKFKRQFYLTHGVMVDVSYSSQQVCPPYMYKTAELTEIVDLLNEHIPNKIKGRHPTIFSQTRLREISQLRMLFMKFAREQGLTLKDITAKCGKVNHTSIMYGLKTANHLIRTDPKVRSIYKDIVQKLNK